MFRFFVGRARVGPEIREEVANVTSQAVKTTKPSLLLCIRYNVIQHRVRKICRVRN